VNSIPAAPRRLLPLVLAPIIVLTDQVSKAVFISMLHYGVPVEVIGDFFRLTLVQNPAIAFSIGHGLPAELRRPLFLVLPLAVVAIILLYYLRTAELTQLQRWLLAAVLGGGVANFVDRVFRPAGVVDFIDVKFYGLFGLARFPTFNVADSSVVVGGILLLLSFLRDELRTKGRELP
jgi:signal peptidase II